MVALRRKRPMTVAQFQDWEPPEHADWRWHLVDGEPVSMAPASLNHGRIQSELAFLLTAHLRDQLPGRQMVTTPGVIPRVRAANNERIPDLAVTCRPIDAGRIMTEPLLIIEILSPLNEALTRANVWTYTTIPSVAEILLLHGTRMEAEVLRRGTDGQWPEAPLTLVASDTMELTSIDSARGCRRFIAARVSPRLERSTETFSPPPLVFGVPRAAARPRC